MHEGYLLYFISYEFIVGSNDGRPFAAELLVSSDPSIKCRKSQISYLTSREDKENKKNKSIMHRDKQ